MPALPQGTLMHPNPMLTRSLRLPRLLRDLACQCAAGINHLSFKRAALWLVARIARPKSSATMRWLELLAIYARILTGALFKPKWRGGPLLPDISAFSESIYANSKLVKYLRLVGSKAPDGADMAPPAGPGMLYLTEAFPTVLECLSRLPFSVMGGLVNRRAVHKLHGGVKVQDGDKLVHSVRVVRDTRTTHSGHTEFDILVSTTHVQSGKPVYEGKLTMVKLTSGRKAQTATAAAAPTAAPGQAAAAGSHFTPRTRVTSPEAAVSPDLAPASATGMAPEPVQEIVEAVEQEVMDQAGNIKLPASAGRRWAMLDGDLSPMHLGTCTARLVGFKRTVANVSCVLAALDSLLQAQNYIPAQAKSRLTVMAVEFKKPCLLPANLEVWIQPLVTGTAHPAHAAATAAAAHIAEVEVAGSSEGASSTAGLDFKLVVSKQGPVVMEGVVSWPAGPATR